MNGASNEEVVNDVVDEVVMLILNIWSVETPRYPTWLQDSGRATRGMPTLRRSQVKSAQEPRGTWQSH
jgi:hypothetical protein